MNKKYKLIAGLMFILGLPQGAGAVIDSSSVNAQAVSSIHLKKDCAGYTNCVTDTTELLDWINSVRIPSSANPLSVEIGPGDFELPAKVCLDAGSIAFNGSGIDVTNLTSASSQGALRIKNCDNLSFQNFTVLHNATGIRWVGGGKSVWNNIELEITNDDSPLSVNAWWGIDCGSGSPPVHYWFGVKARVAGYFYPYAFYDECGEHWFYGGEILATGRPNSSAGAVAIGGVRLQGTAVFQAYGSSIRVLTDQATGVALPNGVGSGLYGVGIAGNAQFHMHGGIISVKSTASTDVSPAAVMVQKNATAHILDTAFNVVPSGEGTGYRVLNLSPATATAATSFMWPQGDTPPAIVSMDGADTFVETDCSATGCLAAGKETHLLIYNSSCTTDPWFDVVTGECRAGGSP